MSTTHKTCSKCGIEKYILEFPQKKRESQKYLSNYNVYCRQCNTERAREWRKNNPNYKTSGKVNSIPEKDRILMSAIRARISQAKQRIKKYSLDGVILNDMELYNLYKDQKGKCALTGVKMTVEKNSPLCLSLDKKEPNQSYTLDNIQWVCWAANRAKGDLSMIDFIGMCECVVEYQKVQRLSNDSDKLNLVE